MILTGKCKEDFINWYLKYDNEFCIRKLENLDDENYCEYFEDLPLKYQYSSYIDFFDSVGIYISDMVNCYHTSMNKPNFSLDGYSACVEGDGFCVDIDNVNIRKEIREVLITRANEVYNSKHEDIKTK